MSGFVRVGDGGPGGCFSEDRNSIMKQDFVACHCGELSESCM